MTQKPEPEKKDSEPTLRNQVIESLKELIPVPYVIVTPTLRGKRMVMGGGTCTHQIEVGHELKMHKKLEATLRKSFPSITKIKIGSDAASGVIGFSMFVKDSVD